MPKVRRNDPCPCGSGRKYKSCCIRQDRLSTSQQLELAGLEGALMSALLEFAQTPTYASSTTQAFALYWGGNYDATGLGDPDRSDVRRMFEWFVHDYRTSLDGPYLVDLFAERESAQFPDEAQQILQAWSQSIMGLYRVVGLDGNAGLSLYDPLRREELEIQDRALAQNVLAGDLIVGRHFSLDGVGRLSTGSLVLPGSYEDGLVAYMANAYAIYCDQHPEAGWDVFLREHGHIFIAYLLSPQAESLRALIGPGTRFHDPAVLRDRLRENTAERQREQERQEREEARKAPGTHRTASGLILPGAESETAPAPEPDQESQPRILIPGRDT